MISSSLLEVGCGVSQDETSFAAGRQAAEQAVATITGAPLSVVMVFTSVRYDLDEVLRGVRSVTGAAPLIGATTAGEICNELYSGSVTVSAVASPELKVRLGIGAGVAADWRAAVSEAVSTPDLVSYFSLDLVSREELIREGKSLFGILFSPGNTRAAASASFEILEELKRLSLGRIPFFGGSAADDWRMERNYVLSGERAVPDALLVAIFETRLRFGIGKAHGFRPVGGTVIVTKSHGHEIQELDGAPALEVLARLLSLPEEELRGKHVTFTTGAVMGTSDPLDQHSIQVISYATATGGLILSQPVANGSMVSLMSSASESVHQTGSVALRKAVVRGGISTPVLAITTFCALRPRLIAAPRNEFRLMQSVLGETPLVGFFSFGEQGLGDDGVSRHNNLAISALVIGGELSHGAQVAMENERLRREMEVKAATLARTEESLRQSRDMFQKFFEHTPLPLAISSVTGEFIKINDAFRSSLGFAADDVIGRTARELMMFPDEEAYLQAARNLLATGTLTDCELTVRTREGELRTGIFSGSVFDNQGETFFLTIMSDLTERKRMEDELLDSRRHAESANRAKSEFLATMSHELRTPLNSILGMGEILLEQTQGVLSDEQRRYLTIIGNSGRHLLALINDILDLSRIEVNKLEPNFELISVEELCRSSLAFVREQVNDKGLSLTLTMDHAPELLYTDQRRLKQILTNLLGNAVKFTPDEGKIGLDVTGCRDKELIRFTVWDTGIGIAAAEQERLFQPFVQVDSSLTRRYEGTGLGLALVARLAELLGGSVAVTSALGSGSRFSVTLPCRDASGTPVRSDTEPAPAPALPPPPDARLILVVEDNPASAEMATSYLQAKGYRVQAVQNGRDAVAAASSLRPDLILMDVQLPVMDGLTAIGKIRNFPPPDNAVPIIVQTALVMPGDRERCLAAGADDYLSKPFRMSELLERIALVLA